MKMSSSEDEALAHAERCAKEVEGIVRTLDIIRKIVNDDKLTTLILKRYASPYVEDLKDEIEAFLELNEEFKGKEEEKEIVKKFIEILDKEFLYHERKPKP